ncbi:MAG TPA: efflux RND transporter periplasmic adaptor subunit [Bacteroidales bacterium]|nr:efflux RND transporter periplasmic adaptor subunit [Bacteroidales bacterium]HPT52241.1 efflux RND transporter periplasmic adaptor subunit [Bacteroidales bacterium]
MKSKKIKRIIWGSIAAVLVLAIAVWIIIGKKKFEEVTLTAEVAKMDSLEIIVTATGEIQPVYKVEVGTQVSGIVEKLYVDFNSKVEKGDLLAELDRSTLQEQVNQATATLSNAESNLTLAKQSYDRIKALYENKAATQTSYEEATNQYIQAKNQVLTAKSDLQRAQVNLSYSKVYSPIAGIVLNKAVEQGQTVAASFNTPTLFTIANNLKQMQVEAKVDEADIGQIRLGQAVTFTVDAFPYNVFKGTVKQVRLEPVVTSNVVTYTVIIDAPNPDEKLFPGMTASVNIIIEKQAGVVVPTEALFFTLNPITQKIMTKNGSNFQNLFKNEEELTNSLKEINKKSVWIKKGNQFEERLVTVGIDDGANTLIVSGIKAGEEVVISEAQLGFRNGKDDERSSFMPQPPGQKKR